MYLIIEKNELKQKIDTIQDEYVVNCISKYLVNNIQVKNCDPFSKEGLNDRLEFAMQDYYSGNTMTIEELKNVLKTLKKKK
jgi:hypothetical protein